MVKVKFLFKKEDNNKYLDDFFPRLMAWPQSFFGGPPAKTDQKDPHMRYKIDKQRCYYN